jgi:hypothetical protein
MIEFVRTLSHPRPSITQAIVRAGDQHYLVSCFAPDKPVFFDKLTDVFLCDEAGNVSDWMEVAGGIGFDMEGAVQDLARRLGKTEADKP